MIKITPKMKNATHETTFKVSSLSTNLKRFPQRHPSVCIIAKEAEAERNKTILFIFVAYIKTMRKVLSPISAKPVIAKEYESPDMNVMSLGSVRVSF